MKGVAKGKTKRRARKERITVLLATNGQVTEQEYLKWLSQEVHKRRRQELSVKVTFIEGEPERMLEKLTARANKASEYDELWLVFDADGKDRRGLVRECEGRSMKNQKVHAIVSDPCFEVWLHAHYESVKDVSDQVDAKRAYAQIHGGRPEDKNLPRDFPYDHWVEATQRCVLPGQCVPRAENDYPPRPGTMMPVLMRRLLGAKERQ